jgi:MFS superfamily sulfate permease-like transporter
MGGRTQFAGLIAAAVVACVLLFLTSLELTEIVDRMRSP